MPSDALKILICDDSLLIRKQLKECIDQSGDFQVIEATDGQAAIDVYKSEKPGLVFMDIVLPILDGIEALKHIKDFDSHANVVMVSSTGTQAYLKKAIEAGATDFIQKPWQKNQIGDMIEKTLKERAERHV